MFSCLVVLAKSFAQALSGGARRDDLRCPRRLPPTSRLAPDQHDGRASNDRSARHRLAFARKTGSRDEDSREPAIQPPLPATGILDPTRCRPALRAGPVAGRGPGTLPQVTTIPTPPPSPTDVRPNSIRRPPTAAHRPRRGSRNHRPGDVATPAPSHRSLESATRARDCRRPPRWVALGTRQSYTIQLWSRYFGPVSITRFARRLPLHSSVAQHFFPLAQPSLLIR